jgi:hypothetical protein
LALPRWRRATRRPPNRPLNVILVIRDQTRFDLRQLPPVTTCRRSIAWRYYESAFATTTLPHRRGKPDP